MKKKPTDKQKELSRKRFREFYKRKKEAGEPLPDRYDKEKRSEYNRQYYLNHKK